MLLKYLGNEKDDDVFVWIFQYGRIDFSKSAFVFREFYDGVIRRVFIVRRDDGSFGLGIVGGREYGIDIIISVVDLEGFVVEQVLKLEFIIIYVYLFDNLKLNILF